MKTRARSLLHRTGIAFIALGLQLFVLTAGPAATPPDPAAPEGAVTEAAGPAPQRVFGDLTDRRATATGIVTASVSAPADGSAADAPATKLDVDTQEGALLAVTLNGEKVSDARIGSLTTDTEHHTAHYTYYGLELHPGPNAITVVPLGADGPGEAFRLNVYGPGRPVAFEQELGGTLRADGRTAVELRVRGIDAWGHHALPGSSVKITVTSGDARLTSPSHTGAPVQSLDATTIAGGAAAVSLVPGLLPGPVTVRVSSGESTNEATYFAAAERRRPLVDGVATVGVGAAPGDTPNRVALYGSGTVGRAGLATVAYDTAGNLERSAGTGAFSEDISGRPYETYGDTSVRRDDALTRDRLYARYDRGQSHAMWGEFQAQTGSPNAVGGFSQLVDGLQVRIAGKNSAASGFAAKNDVAFARAVFPASGLSALAQPLHAGIIAGSEQVTLVALDRRTGVVVSQTVLARNVDYDLDYVSGQIRFIEIPLPFDAFFNPQQVLIRYEYSAVGSSARTTGGRGDVALGNGPGALRIGTGYVNDTTGSGNYDLFSQEIGATSKRASFALSHAASRGGVGFSDVPTDGIGHAWSGRLALTGDRDKLEASFQSTTENFTNPFGGLSTPGLVDYRGSFTHALRGNGSFSLAYDAQRNDYQGVRSSQSQGQMRLREAVSKNLTLSAGLSEIASNAPAAAASSAPATTPPAAANTVALQAEAGFDWHLSKHVGLAASRLQTLGGATVASSPSQTQGQFSVDFGTRGRAYVREIITDAPVQTFATAANGLTAATGSTRMTTFGLERAVGRATTVNEEFEIDHTANGDELRALSGVRERFKFGTKLTGDAAFQRAEGSATAAFQTYSSSLEWRPGDRFKASGSFQSRTGEGVGSTLFVGAAGALTDDLSLFGSTNKSVGPGIGSGDSRVGVAWRPSQSERGVTLFGFRSASGISSLGGRSDVLSFEQIYRPAERLELAGRYAYKLDGDSYYAARSAVAGLRATQRIGRKFDAGIELSALGSRSAPSENSTGLAVEAGFRAAPSLRIAGGWNVTRVADPTLTSTPPRKGFYFTLTSMIDRIFGWGAR